MASGGQSLRIYHGSNQIFRLPNLQSSRKLLDFGAGFYVTSDYDQAASWALSKTSRVGFGRPTVNVYELDMGAVAKLKIYKFNEPNKEWLDFVVANRKGLISRPNYDIVEGPIANDSTLFVINNYISGVIDENTALSLLLPQKLKDQYAFLTEKALACLKFIEEVLIDG